jgi:hypothetical protein
MLADGPRMSLQRFTRAVEPTDQGLASLYKMAEQPRQVPQQSSKQWRRHRRMRKKTQLPASCSGQLDERASETSN